MVRRQSFGPISVQNGCTVVSIRPASKSKPIASATCRLSACCAAIGIIALEPRGIDRAGDFLQARQQRRELLLQIGEDRREIRRARARLVAFQQRVVGAGRVAPALGLLAHEAEDLFQPRREGGEIRFAPRLRPRLARQRRRPRQVLHQPRGQLRRAVVIAAPFAHIRRAQRRLLLVRAGRQLVLARLDPVADFRPRCRADASAPPAGRVAPRDRPRPSAACRFPGPTTAGWPRCCRRRFRGSVAGEIRRRSWRSNVTAVNDCSTGNLTGNHVNTEATKIEMTQPNFPQLSSRCPVMISVSPPLQLKSRFPAADFQCHVRTPRFRPARRPPRVDHATCSARSTKPAGTNSPANSSPGSSPASRLIDASARARHHAAKPALLARHPRRPAAALQARNALTPTAPRQARRHLRNQRHHHRPAGPATSLEHGHLSRRFASKARAGSGLFARRVELHFLTPSPSEAPHSSLSAMFGFWQKASAPNAAAFLGRATAISISPRLRETLAAQIKPRQPIAHLRHRLQLRPSARRLGRSAAVAPAARKLAARNRRLQGPQPRSFQGRNSTRNWRALSPCATTRSGTSTA